MLNLILFGPPGSGKGTQAEKLIEKYNLKHISTGNLLRSEVSAKTQLGLEAKKYMDAGELVPDEVVIGMISNALDEHFDSVEGFIFDGFPRTVAQAEALDQLLKDKSLSITKVLSLHVSEDELVDRLLKRAADSGRTDDNEETIRHRMQVYREKTSVVADYYADQRKLSDIKGEGDIQTISTVICASIDG